MKHLMVAVCIGVTLLMTGCIQDKIDDAKMDCQQSANDALRWAQESCEKYLDEALEQFWDRVDKEIDNAFAEVGCISNGPGDFEYDCSGTLLCPPEEGV